MKDRIFSRDTLAPSSWKNGGGVTREIAVSTSGQPWWRLSIADVTENGAFSSFEGLERILTVIEGAGMVLARKAGDLVAGLHAPVRFSGAERIVGLLPNGPIQDFNVMFDPCGLNASVLILHGDDIAAAGPPAPVLTLIYCLRGTCRTAGFVDLSRHCGIIDPTGPVRAAESDVIALRVDIRRA